MEEAMDVWSLTAHCQEYSDRNHHGSDDEISACAAAPFWLALTVPPPGHSRL